MVSSLIQRCEYLTRGDVSLYLFPCTYLYTVRRLYNIDSYDVCNIHSLSFHNIESLFVIFLQLGGMQNEKQQHIFIQPMNKREFVARCLMEVCGLDDGMAFSIMMKAHQFGISVIGNYHMEQAELYKVRLLEGKYPCL